MKKRNRFLALLLTVVLALSAATFVGCGPTDKGLNDLIKPQRDYFGF